MLLIALILAVRVVGLDHHYTRLRVVFRALFCFVRVIVTTRQIARLLAAALIFAVRVTLGALRNIFIVFFAVRRVVLVAMRVVLTVLHAIVIDQCTKLLAVLVNTLIFTV